MAERKTEKLTEAAEKTTAALQGLRSRLSEAGARAAPPEIPDELGKQLEEYFASASLPRAADPSASAAFDDIRSRVMEGVVEKIVRAWQEPSGRLSAVFKDELVERLIERILDAIQKENTHG